ncbi:MAG: hypothetical protein CMJ49_08090 [Planctomycetaceae bacterium]|nr:hypothetical protein [Planctomycetaceae bacterium]
MSPKNTNSALASARFLCAALAALTIVASGGCTVTSMLGGNPLQVEQNYKVAQGANDRANDAPDFANAQTCDAAAQTARDQANQAFANADTARTTFQEKYAALQNLKAMAAELKDAKEAWAQAKWDYTDAIADAEHRREQVEDGNDGAISLGRQALDNAIAAIEDMRSTKSRMASAISALANNYSAYKDFVDSDQDWAQDISQADLNAAAQAWQNSVSSANDALLQEAKDELYDAKDKMGDWEYNLLPMFHTWSQGHMSNANTIVADLRRDPSFGASWSDPNDDLDLSLNDLSAAVPKIVDSGNMAVTSVEISVAEATEQAMDAATEANRNAIRAYQACNDGQLPPHVDPDDFADMDFDNPFNEYSNPYPSWNSTFWDISSP